MVKYRFVGRYNPMTRTTRRDALLQIERAMVRIRRSQTRRAIGRLMERQLRTRFNLAHSFVVDALDEAREVPGNEPSVGMVAEHLGVDPSRASRMVADAVRGGYVRRVASQADGRRMCLELTGEGRKLLKTTSSFRRRVFSKVMASWTESECVEFARLLAKFIEPLKASESSLRRHKTAKKRTS